MKITVNFLFVLEFMYVLGYNIHCEEIFCPVER